MQKVFELTQSQTKLITDDKSKAIAFVTGFGGGKTFVLANKMVKLKTSYPQVDLLYLFPTFSMFRDILFPTLTEILEGTGIGYRINKTTGEIFFDCGGRVILKSMDHPETIVGMNVFAVLLDELDTLPTKKAWEVWIKAIARARKVVKDEDGNTLENQLIVGSTPEGYRLLYKLFVKEKPENYRLIQASGRENIHLPKDYYDNMRAIYPSELVDAYIDGKFVNMAVGAVYKQYDRLKCDTDAIYRKGEVLHISMDFNVRNMNAVVFVKRDKVFTGNPEFPYEGQHSYHAVRHLHSIVDTPELIQVIQNRYPNSPVFAYPDASGKNASSKGFTTSDISLLQAAGFETSYPNKNPRVMDRVQAVNSGLMTGLIKVNVRECPEVAEALEQQVFNQITELPEKSATNDIDDINDSFGYFIYRMFPIARNSFKSKDIRGF